MEMQPHFIIKGDGKVGIGTAEPLAKLNIKRTGWNPGTGDFGPASLLFTDPADNIIGGFFNEGTDANHEAGAFVVMSNSSANFPAFGVFNNFDQLLPFGVMGNGTIGMGIDVSPSGTFTPEAQVNICKSNVYNYRVRRIKKCIQLR